MGIAQEPLQLIREATRQGNRLEPYNDQIVRNTLREIGRLYSDASIESASLEQENSHGLFHHNNQARLVALKHLIERNKRILLAYHAARLNNIAAAAFAVQTLPLTFTQVMTASEHTFAQEYGDNLCEYFAKFGDLVDLASGVVPPKELFIQVRVNQDCGIIQTEWGQIHLNANTQHYLRRSDVKNLIDQGLVTHVK